MTALVLLAVTGCGSLPPGDRQVYSDRGLQAADSATRHQVVHIAAQQIGAPYRYGGNGRRGFDCSGLVQFAYRQVGIEVPRTTESQWRMARTPERRYLLPGDLLFFHIGGKKDRHVAIYEGDGVFIHAPSSGKQVSRASLDNPFWQGALIGAKTFL